jgi:hypothetical protein
MNSTPLLFPAAMIIDALSIMPNTRNEDEEPLDKKAIGFKPPVSRVKEIHDVCDALGISPGALAKECFFRYFRTVAGEIIKERESRPTYREIKKQADVVERQLGIGSSAAKSGAQAPKAGRAK